MKGWRYHSLFVAVGGQDSEEELNARLRVTVPNLDPDITRAVLVEAAEERFRGHVYAVDRIIGELLDENDRQGVVSKTHP